MTKILWLVGAISFTLVALAQADSLESRLGIVNGSEVQPNEPIAKAIVDIDGGTCTGVLVAADVVVTAAHCTASGAGGVGSSIRLRSATEESCGVAKVTHVAYHPDSIDDISPEGASKWPDFAIVHLDRPLCGLVPALISPELDVKENDRITVAGYGQGNHSRIRAEKIQITLVKEEKDSIMKIFEGENADELKELSEFLNANLKYYHFGLPAVENTTMCFGDSGGPSFIEKDGRAYLIGVNSMIFQHSKGAVDCEGGYLNVITNLKPYMPWMLEQINAWQNGSK